MAMVPGTPNSGLVVRVQDLYTPESPLIVPNQSLRVVGSVERFDAVSGIAILTDGESSLRLDLQHLRELPLRVGSLFEFVGELEINPLHQHLTLKARVGRNVDGRDMRVFDKVLQLRRKFEKESRTLIKYSSSRDSMELCKQLQAEDIVTIHTFEDATSYTRLRFSLLASNWLPRPLGVLLWSLLHITLLVCVPLLLLVPVTLILLVPLSVDVLYVTIHLPGLALFVFAVIALVPCLLVTYALVWIWRVVTCQCRTVPATVRAQSDPGFARSPLQVGIGRLVLFIGRRGDHNEACVWDVLCVPFATVVCVKELVLAWGPYWRLKLGSWCREIAILDDAIAI